jgi:hypothetical protein
MLLSSVDCVRGRQNISLFTIQVIGQKPVDELVGKYEFRTMPVPSGLKKELVERSTQRDRRGTLFPGLAGPCDRINWETENRITLNFPAVPKARSPMISFRVFGP